MSKSIEKTKNKSFATKMNRSPERPQECAGQRPESAAFGRTKFNAKEVKSSLSARNLLLATITAGLFLLQLFLLTKPIRAASNINPVWLVSPTTTTTSTSELDNKRAENSPKSANSHKQNNDTQFTVKQTLGRNPLQTASKLENSPKDQNQLKTLPSSLQPTIVSLDNNNSTGKQQPTRLDIRRSDSSVYQDFMPSYKPPNRTQANFSHEATSLDHQWSGASSGSQQQQQQAYNNQTNFQVQFDESPLNFIRAGSRNTGNRRLELNETSTLRPQFYSQDQLEASNQLGGQDQQTGAEFDERPPPASKSSSRRENSTIPLENANSLDEFLNSPNFIKQGLRGGRPSSAFDALSQYYYSPELNRWNFSTGPPLQSQESGLEMGPQRHQQAQSHELMGDTRRKLHTSGTQYDLREFYNNQQQDLNKQVLDADNQLLLSNDFSRPQNSTEFAGSHVINYGFVPMSQLATSEQEQATGPFGPATTTTRVAPFQPGPRRTTVPPTQYVSLAGAYEPLAAGLQPGASVSANLNLNVHPQQSLDFNLAPRLVQYPARYNLRPSSMIASGARGHKRRAGSNSAASKRRKATPSGNRNSILRYIKPTTPRPKKSLLNVFKLNSNQEPVFEEHLKLREIGQNRLEKSFYDTSHPFGAPTGAYLAYQFAAPAPDVSRQPVQVVPEQALFHNLKQQQHSEGAEQLPAEQQHNPYTLVSQLSRPAASYYQRPTLAPLMYPIDPLGSPIIHQTTVPPAPSSLRYYQQQQRFRRRRVPSLPAHQYYLHQAGAQADRYLPQGSLTQHLYAAPKSGQQAPARAGQPAFIPVVAVSVTKTSPAPQVDSTLQASMDQEFSGANHFDVDGNRNGMMDQADQQQQYETSSAAIDDYLNMKLNQRTAAKFNPKSDQENSFGNLASGSSSQGTQYKATLQQQQQFAPKPAEHTTTIKSAVFGFLPQQATQPLVQALTSLGQRSTSAQDLFGAGAAPAQLGQAFEQVHQEESAALEEPQPSLALQLQANSLVRNELAHSFYEDPQQKALQQQQRLQMQPSHKYYQRPAGTIGVYPASQAQFHGFQLLQSGDQSQQQQQAGLMNPLLFHQNLAGQLLSTAASEPNPFLPFMLASPSAAALEHKSNGKDDEPAPEDQEAEADETRDPEGTLVSKKLASAQQSLKQGNKKRSSDFFASAGQLLLSALPLLLAPTLGLMFASSPNSAARFQKHSPGGFQATTADFHANPATAQLASGSELRPNYIDSMSDGITANNSPVPQALVTTTTQAPEHPTNSTVKANSGPRARPTSRPTKTTPRPVKTTIILTTLGPPPFNDNGSLSARKNLHIAGGKNSTILLDTSNKVTILDADALSSLNSSIISSLNDSNNQPGKGEAINLYDAGAGYDGADFDAQFASLHKNRSNVSQLNKQLLLDAHSLTNNSDSFHKRNHYHFQLPTEQATSSSHHSDDERLFPVVTFPLQRRKMVSLVTSSGNKTLPDSSDKYFLTKGQQSEAKQNLSKYSMSFDASNNDDNQNDDGYETEEENSKINDLSGNLSSINHAVIRNQHNYSLSRKKANPRRASLGSKNLGSRQRRKRSIEEVPVKLAGQAVKLAKESLRPVGNNLQPTGSDKQLAVSGSVLQPELAPRKGKPGDRSNLSGERETAANQDNMRVDGSKKASHIITTMITHHTSDSAEGNSPDYVTPADLHTAAPQSGRIRDFNSDNSLNSDSPGSDFVGGYLTTVNESSGNRSPFLVDEEPNGQSAFNRKRQMIESNPNPVDENRYSALAQADNSIGNHRMFSSSQLAEVSDDNYEAANRNSAPPSDDFSSGGRGRFPPAQLNTSNRHGSEYGPSSSSKVLKATRYSERPNDSGGAGNGRNVVGAKALVLTEDTKKALANFNELLIKDTLQVDGKREHQGRRFKAKQPVFHGVKAKHRRESYGGQMRPTNQFNYEQNNFVNTDQNWEGQGTERSVMFRTTPLPLPMPVLLQRDPHDYNTPNPVFYKQSASSYNQNQAPSGGQHYIEPANYGRPPMRDRVNLIDSGDSNGGSLFSQNDDGSSSNQPEYHYNSHMGHQPQQQQQAPLLHYQSAQRGKLQHPVEQYMKPGSEYPAASYMTDRLNRSSMAGENFNSVDTRHAAYSSANYSSPESRRSEQFNYQPQYYSPPPPPPPPHPMPPKLRERMPPPPIQNSYGSSSYESPGYQHYQPNESMHHYSNNNSYSPPSASQQYQQPVYPQHADHQYQVAPGNYLKAPESHGNPHYGPPNASNYPQKPYDPYQQQPRQLYPHSAQAGPEYYATPPPRYTRYSSAESNMGPHLSHQQGSATSATDKSDTKTASEYLKQVQFSDSDRDKLMASYLTCDGLLNDNDHCLERLSCEFSDPQNIEKANKLDRAVSSILLGHILINTYIPNQFKLRLKSASLYGYTQSGSCSKFACNKLTKAVSSDEESGSV